ncbi:MAG TPA: DNA polymerase IV [Candidatus Hodarchaeales archaeon]|nr:DNA polymerase IV [Candidatus Hodarchaeales archaeon]
MSDDIFSPEEPHASTAWILHLDLDAFYASVEERLHPEYRGKPVIVGPDPKLSRRGVVLTANYVARGYGVRSAMPIVQAATLCPDAIYSFSGFEHYSQASHEVMAILSSRGKFFQQASIDEAFLDITDLVNDWRSPLSVGKGIQDSIISETGLSCSIGISSTKILAKIATDMQKPKGITIIAPSDLPQRINDLSLSKIPGIGKKTFARLQENGLETIGQVTLHKRRHWTGNELLQFVWDVAHGLTSASLEDSGGYRSRSSSREGTFDSDVSDRDTIQQTLRGLLEELLGDVGSFRTISIKVRLSDFRTFTRSHSFPHYVDKENFELIFDNIQRLFEEFASRGSVRLLGVRASNFKVKGPSPQHLDKFI